MSKPAVSNEERKGRQLKMPGWMKYYSQVIIHI